MCLRRVGRVRIVVSDAIQVPFSTRVLGPADVVLPVAVLADRGLTRVALRHELPGPYLALEQMPGELGRQVAALTLAASGSRAQARMERSQSGRPPAT